MVFFIQSLHWRDIFVTVLIVEPGFWRHLFNKKVQGLQIWLAKVDVHFINQNKDNEIVSQK